MRQCQSSAINQLIGAKGWPETLSGIFPSHRSLYFFNSLLLDVDWWLTEMSVWCKQILSSKHGRVWHFASIQLLTTLTACSQNNGVIDAGTMTMHLELDSPVTQCTGNLKLMTYIQCSDCEVPIECTCEKQHTYIAVVQLLSFSDCLFATNQFSILWKWCWMIVC